MNIEEIRAIGRRQEVGAWVTDVAPFGDLALKVRARFNSDYVRRAQELFQAEPAENKPDGVLTPEADRRHLVELLVETVLCDWRNMATPSGEPIAFSQELARDLISDARSPAFMNAVFACASVVGLAGKLEEEADAKN